MSENYPAQTVDDAYRACNPDVALPSDSDLYVDLTAVRGDENLAENVALNIRRTEPGRFLKQLISGHRGTGKSTELKRLVKNLDEARYFPVYLDIEDTLDLGDIEYQDVLVAIAQAVVREAMFNDISINEKLLADLKAWFDERILTEEQKQEIEATLKTEAGVEGHVPFVAKALATIIAQFKSSSSQKKELRRKLEAEMSGFLDKLNVLLGQAKDGASRKGFLNLVVIVDGLEKMRYYDREDGESSHTALFVHHAAQLAAPECHIIYTIPILLCFKESMKEEFPDEPILLPMVDYTHKDGKECLAKLLEKRVANSVFDSDKIVPELIAISGGSVRDLLRLVRSACPPRGDKITMKDAEKAIQRLTNEFERLMRVGDIEILLNIETTRDFYYDRERGRLLEQRLFTNTAMARSGTPYILP